MDDSHLCPSPSQPSLAAIPPTRTLFSSPLPQSSSSHSSLFTSIYPQGEVPLPFFCVTLPPSPPPTSLPPCPAVLILPFFVRTLFSSTFFSPLQSLPVSSSSHSHSHLLVLPSFTPVHPVFSQLRPLVLRFIPLPSPIPPPLSSFLPFFSPPFILWTLSPGFFFFLFCFFAACLTHSFALTDCVYIDILSSVHGTAMAQKPHQRIRTMHANKKKVFQSALGAFHLSPSEKNIFNYIKSINNTHVI